MSKSYKVKLYCFDKASRCTDNRASKWSLFREPMVPAHGWGEGPQAVLRTASRDVNACPPYCNQGDGRQRCLHLYKEVIACNNAPVKKAFKAESSTIRKTFNMYIMPLMENLLLSQILVSCI